MVFSFVSLLYAFGAFAQLKSGESFLKVNHTTISVNNADSMHSDTSQYVSNKTITHSVFFNDPEGNVLELHKDPAQ